MGALENDLDHGLLLRREAYAKDHPNATVGEALREGSTYVGPQFSYDHDTVINMIDMESSKGLSKHGNAPKAKDIEALSVLLEEVGEVATAINQNQPKEELRKEIVQCASVCIRWLMGNMTFSRKA